MLNQFSFNRQIKRGASLYRGLCFLFVLLASAWIAIAGTGGGATAYPETTLEINLDRNGNAFVSLSGDRPLPPAVVPEKVATESLSEALGCNLEAVEVQQEGESWNVRGKCDRAFPRTGWIVSGQIERSPLINLMRSLQIDAMDLAIVHTRAGFTRSSASSFPASWSSSSVEYYYYLTPETTSPEPLRLEFGYRLQDLGWILAPLAAFLPIGLGLTLWMRHAALHAQNADPDAVWFGYTRFLNWSITGIWLGWLAIYTTSDLGQFIDFTLWCKVAWQRTAIDLSLFFLPPSFVTIACYVLSYPVFARLRGMQWTPQDLLRQAILRQTTYICPIACMTVGIMALQDDPRWVVVWWAAAYASRVFFLRLWMKAQEMTPHALTVGELRDRIFDLAQTAGVKLQQVYVLPTGKGKLANAFASQGNNILLGNYLLKHLSKREVDAVVAHELGHLKYKHPQALVNVLALAISLSALLAALLTSWLPGLPWWFGVALIVILVFYYFSRRFEYAADAEAVALCGDPEACITALMKVNRLNLMPIEWSQLDEQLLTHPSTFRRIQAIAEQSGISSNRLQEVIATINAASERYKLPPSSLDEDKVFSTRFKNNIILRNLWLAIAIKISIPTGVAYLVQLGIWDGEMSWRIYWGGLAIAIALWWMANNFLAVWGYGELKRRFAAKLQRKGIDPEAWGGIFVGFAPGSRVRIYENFGDWDVGFLFLGRDRLCYIGEQIQFALLCDRMMGLSIGPGLPFWGRSWRVYITGCREEGSTACTFNLRPGNVRSLQQMAGGVSLLHQQLRSWHAQPETAIALPEAIAQLDAPQIDNVTSISPRALMNPIQLLFYIYFLWALALGVAVLLNLHVEGIAYVSLVIGLTTVFEILPYYLCKDTEANELRM